MFLYLNLQDDQLNERMSAYQQADQLIVLIPSEEVWLTTITMPRLSRSRLLKAIPYALEEQVLDEVSDLHFALGKPHHHEWPVAVISRKKMQAYLDFLHAWDLKPDQMLPAVLALPYSKEKWFGLAESAIAFRTGEHASLICDACNQASFLELTQVETEIISLTDLEKIAEPASINLLQQAFAIKKNKWQTPSILKWGAGFLGIWLVLLILSPLVSYFILQSRLSLLNEKMANSPPITHWQAKWRAAQENGNQAFLNKLIYLGEAKKLFKEFDILNLDFQDPVLMLDITSASPEIIAHLSQYLAQKGLRVTQTNTVLAAEKIKTRLEIR